MMACLIVEWGIMNCGNSYSRMTPNLNFDSITSSMPLFFRVIIMLMVILCLEVCSSGMPLGLMWVGKVEAYGGGPGVLLNQLQLVHLCEENGPSFSYPCNVQAGVLQCCPWFWNFIWYKIQSSGCLWSHAVEATCVVPLCFWPKFKTLVMTFEALNIFKPDYFSIPFTHINLPVP